MNARFPDRRSLLLAAPLIALGGCSNIIGPLPASQIYILHVAPGQKKDGSKVHWSLAITRPTAPDSLDNNRIALARDGIQLDYYANAIWSDNLPDLIQTQLLDSFEETGRSERVGREETGLHADYKLLTDLRHFEARYGAPGAPPTVTITIVAYIMGARTHEILSTVVASASRPCAANSVAAVVEAFGLAMAETLDHVTGWALSLSALS